MRYFFISTSVILGAILGGAVLWCVVSFVVQPRHQDETASQQIRRLALDMNIPGVQAIVEEAHQASLNGDNNYGELQEMFTVFNSTAPEMREFAESWADEMPDSPYALTALSWSLHTAGWYMRGEELTRFTYMESMPRFGNLHWRAARLAGRAFKIAPDLVTTSDATIRLRLTTSGGWDSLELQSRFLNKVMTLTPNRDSLISALSVTQPNWGGSFDGAVELCALFAGLVKDFDGYSPEICLVEAAYTYEYGEGAKALAREALKGINAEYLDYARRQDWAPGLSRRADQKILAYLEGEGKSDFELARYYDSEVSIPQGLTLIGKAVFAAYRQEARDKLANDPFNPKLIKILTEPQFYADDDKGTYDSDEQIRLAKLALRAAPYDPTTWRNIALVYHSSSDPTDPSENAYFENSMIFSNLSPTFYFRYLSAKRTDYFSIRKRLRDGELSEDQLATVDEAVICPLIRLVRLKEMTCKAIADSGIGFSNSSCSGDPRRDESLPELIALAESRRSCSKAINSEPIDLFNLTPVNTDISLPEPIAR